MSFVDYQVSISKGETIGVLALFAKHAIGSVEGSLLDSLSNSTAFVVQQFVMEDDLRRVRVLES